MPQPMRTPEPKKAQTTFMDDDLLPDDMPTSEMPQEAPTSGALTKGKTAGKGLPTSRVDTGTVSVHNPKPELVSNINPSDFIMNYQSANEEDDMSDDGPEDPEITTLPAIIQTALSTEHGEIKSYQMANVVRQSPGPMQAQLQKIGRDIFSQYSETPKSLKDIYAVTSMTNSETEVKLMLAWVVMHGRKISEAEYNFPSMPGYKPKAELWEDEGARFLIVRETPKDFAGESIEESFDDPDFEEKVDGHQCLWYIYGWDEPKGKIGDGGVRADLLEMAKTYAKDSGKITIREAYETVVGMYLAEDIDDDLDVTSFEKPSTGLGRGYRKIAELFLHLERSGKSAKEITQELESTYGLSLPETLEALKRALEMPRFKDNAALAYAVKILPEYIDGPNTFLLEDTKKVKDGYQNIGDTGKKHSKKPMTKKKADAQRKAMFASGYKESIEDFEDEEPPLEVMAATEFDDIPETELYDVPFDFDFNLEGSKEFMEGILDRPRTEFEITWKAGALVAGPIRRGFEKIKAQILYNDPQAVVNVVEEKEFGQRSFTMYASNIDPIVAQAAGNVFEKWAAQIKGEGSEDEYEED